MAKSCFPSYAALLALALCASPALSQDAGAFERVNLDGNVLGAVALPSDVSSVAGDADATTTQVTEDRTAEELARSANDAAAPEDENRGDDDVTVLGGSVTTLGSWLGLQLDDFAVTTLVNALSQPSHYDPTIGSPVCVLQINSGTFQTVAGTNYRYEILGCPIGFADELGACRNRSCASATYEVAVFQQTWTDTLQVSSITQKQ